MRVWMGTIVLTLLAAGAANADAPAYMPLQGFLTNTDGTPVDGEVDLGFALYDTDVTETPLWSETQTVLVEDGFVTAYLGEGTDLALDIFRDNTSVWLGVTVGEDPEMPRFQIATTGFAAFAQYAGDAATLGGHDAAFFAAAGGDVSWTDLIDVPAGFVDGTDDGFTTEEDLTAILDDNYRGSSWVPAWTDITSIPDGFLDGVDDDTLYAAGDGLSLGFGNAFYVNFAGTGAEITAARSDHTHAAYLTAEADPQVGTLTAGRWCTSDGTAISCNTVMNPPGMTEVSFSGSTVNTGDVRTHDLLTLPGWDAAMFEITAFAHDTNSDTNQLYFKALHGWRRQWANAPDRNGATTLANTGTGTYSVDTQASGNTIQVVFRHTGGSTNTSYVINVRYMNI